MWSLVKSWKLFVIVVPLLAIAAWLALRSSGSYSSPTALARSFLEIRTRLAPTQAVLLEGTDPRLSAPLRALNAEDVIVAPNQVVALWTSRFVSRDFLLFQSSPDTNVWTLYRWYPVLGHRPLATITNE
jgi:hypothetical protein